MTDYEIHVLFEEPITPDESLSALLTTTALAALRQAAAPAPGAVNLLLAGDDYLQTLNRNFRGYDKPTDVLSFAADMPLDGSGRTHLGDIAVSVPTARRQAEVGGHELTAELQLLTVHGVLHLLGYDHDNPAEKQAMWAAQAAVLQRLGAAISPPVWVDDDE